MRKFVFNLTTLLNLREWEEQGARQNYLVAIRKARQMELATRDAGNTREAIIESWNKSNVEAFSRNERLALEGSILEASRVEESYRIHLEKAKEEERAARAKVNSAIRKRKAIQNLKQRRFEAYTADTAKAELSEIEDIYNARANERKKL
ncbi:MAG: hypothetical protein VYC82_08325 [Verrucomicrobiota bacterium]|nr:hypothetical protein [Verrucomicrobiota bacterium]